MSGPEFPTDIFPPDVRAFVEAQAEALQVPRDLVGTPALSVISAASAGRAMVRISDEWHEPLNEYYLPVAASGERKSQAMKKVIEPLEDREQELTEMARPKVEQARVERDVDERRLGDIKTRASKEEDKILADNLTREAATPEAIAKSCRILI